MIMPRGARGGFVLLRTHSGAWCCYQRLGRGHPPASNSQKFSYLKRKAKRGVGEVAKKLKENFGVAKLFYFYLTFSNGRLGATNQRHALIVRDGH